MFSVPDVMVVSVLALLLFGPDRLPKVMRQAGRLMRDLQNTSHSFIAEMERAADTTEMPPPPPPPAPEPLSLNLKTDPQTDPQKVESSEAEA
jgi:TatA/E family protein of Tat protein translocase